MKPLSKRKLTRYRLADDLAAKVRQAIAAPVCDPNTQLYWNEVMELLLKWMRVAGKETYK